MNLKNDKNVFHNLATDSKDLNRSCLIECNGSNHIAFDEMLPNRAGLALLYPSLTLLCMMEVGDTESLRLSLRI